MELTFNNSKSPVLACLTLNLLCAVILILLNETDIKTNSSDHGQTSKRCYMNSSIAVNCWGSCLYITDGSEIVSYACTRTWKPENCVREAMYSICHCNSDFCNTRSSFKYKWQFVKNKVTVMYEILEDVISLELDLFQTDCLV